ncbi:MAG: hypothetical protein L0220_01055 [Acidobacteria bacterium]|nr:hypothetical protein [Acidobacteriota bacterium]
MFPKTTKIITIFILNLLLSASAFSQQKQESSQPKQDSTAAKPQEYVDISGFKGRIFEIKNADPYSIASIITPLGSGFKGTLIRPNRDPKLITVRDFPENIAVIEEAIKRLDVSPPLKVAEPPRYRDPNLELRMFLLIASNKEGASNQYPDEIKDVLKQVQSTLNYKNYYLMTPIVQRIFAPSGARGEGVTTVGAPLFDKNINARYSYSINQFLAEQPFAETKTLFLNGFDFSISGVMDEERYLLGSARIVNKLMIRDGEKVVLGTASLLDKALVLVLSVKVVP